MDRTYIPLDDSTGHPSYHREWYVLRTKQHAERQVAHVLESRGIITFLPLLRRRLVEPLFPCYLFLNIDCSTDEYLRSRSAPGVSYILSSDGVPAPVPAELVEEIRRRVDRENTLPPAARFAQGDRVVVTSGPFRGLEAIFDRAMTPQGRCQVLLQILGRLTRVQVGAEYLGKARA